MKAGLVVAESPSPLMDNSTTSINVDDMDWSDIHKMVEKAGGQ